jgi:hypothetical protein
MGTYTMETRHLEKHSPNLHHRENLKSETGRTDCAAVVRDSEENQKALILWIKPWGCSHLGAESEGSMLLIQKPAIGEGTLVAPYAFHPLNLAS